MKSRMRPIKSAEQSHENDWAEKLKKEAESWRRKTVPIVVEHKGVFRDVEANQRAGQASQ